MTIKYSVADGSAIFDFSCPDATMELARTLLESENVIKLSIVKKTRAQYFKEIEKRANAND